jgi:hypothetical protein
MFDYYLRALELIARGRISAMRVLNWHPRLNLCRIATCLEGEHRPITAAKCDAPEFAARQGRKKQARAV